jgi:hypothetical protein
MSRSALAAGFARYQTEWSDPKSQSRYEILANVERAVMHEGMIKEFRRYYIALSLKNLTERGTCTMAIALPRSLRTKGRCRVALRYTSSHSPTAAGTLLAEFSSHYDSIPVPLL